jgi:1-acyl-sn-glycerol-3-phosphate acyltransferase
MGAFNLAKEANVEILPIVMTGTNKMFRKGWLMNWRNRVAIRVMKPIPVEEVAATDVKDMAQRVRESMIEELAKLRTEVATAKK